MNTITNNLGLVILAFYLIPLFFSIITSINSNTRDDVDNF
jgi:hypothetical protein